MRTSALAFLFGVLLVHQLAAPPSFWWGLLLFPLLALARRHQFWAILSFAVAGIVWTAFRADLVLSDSLAPELEGRNVVVEGVVADLPRTTEFGQRFIFDVDHAAVADEPVKVPRRLLLSVRENEGDSPTTAFSAGSRWRLTVRLKRPHGFANPGGFDYEAYLFRQRIRARGYVRDQPAAEPLSHEALTGLGVRINRWREGVGFAIQQALAGSPFAGIVNALANGDQSHINADQWQVLRRTGTLHLVAISGLHISLVSGLVFFLTRWMWALPGRTVLWVPAPVVGAGAALVAAAVYAALAGFTIPTQRALIMVGVAMAAIIFRWRVRPSWILAAALLAVLVHDPFAVMATGFWLSFAAVAVIVWFMQGESASRSRWRKLVTLQWAIGIGMLPMMIVIFQQTSLVAPMANMVAVPMFDLLVVPLTLLGVGLQSMSLATAGAGLLSLATWTLQVLWPVLEYLNQLPGSQWVQHEPAGWTVACAAVGVLILLAPRGWPARWLGIVWIAPLLLVRPAPPPPGAMQLTLLDVGQGLSAVVRTATHTLVYDTGPQLSSRFDAGAAVVVPFLRARGIRQVDMVVVSHGDNDHIGGLASIQAGIPVQRLVSNVTNSELAAQPCLRGESWVWDGVQFTILNPTREQDRSSNNGSCVVKVVSPHGSVLLPGDIERATERRLVTADPASLSSTVLVAPHHGSRTSSTRDFIAAVAPQQVLFPVGYRSRYGHPHRNVVRRYREAGIATFDSATAGAIDVTFDREGIATRSYRQSTRRFWRTF